MNELRKIFSILYVLSILWASGFSQTDTVRYNTDFKFEDGLYFSFEMVKNNNPVPGARIITKYDHTDPLFYDNILKDKSIAFFDKNGARQEVPSSKLWGFSRNGVLYIRISEGFHRITIVGTISHFVANITTYSTQYYDPYSYGRYGGSPYYNPYYNPYSPYNQRTTRNSEMKQYLLDFETGKIYDYDYKAVEMFLMKDPELYDEFAALRKRKQKQMKFFYLRKFNERNPLYIPVEKRF